MRELALFAGAGGGILGGLLLGWRTVCAVEIDIYCRRVLMQRQDDGCLEPFPIWDDVRTFDGRPWHGCVDIVTGGFPCQDISAAGKGAGITGERSGLWKEMARIIGEVRPRFVFVENSPMLAVRGIGTVLGDLSEMGFDLEWGIVSAADVGAPHKRERIWILGYANSNGEPIGSEHDEASVVREVVANTSCNGRQERRPESEGREGRPTANECGASVSDTYGDGLQGPVDAISGQGAAPEPRRPTYPAWWQSEPDVGRLAHGIPNRVDRLKAAGNAQVPAVAATAFRLLMERQA